MLLLYFLKEKRRDDIQEENLKLPWFFAQAKNENVTVKNGSEMLQLVHKEH